MSYSQFIITATKVAVAEVFKYAKAVPADKLDWKPLDEGRSVLDICKELAMCPTWTTMILKGQPMPDFDEAAMEEFGKMSASWTTAEACEEVCLKNLEAFYAAAAEFPEARLTEKYTLPFDGGHEITQSENLAYPLWNFEYHQGQIAYIQTLYGDKKMYW